MLDEFSNGDSLNLESFAVIDRLKAICLCCEWLENVQKVILRPAKWGCCWEEQGSKVKMSARSCCQYKNFTHTSKFSPFSYQRMFLFIHGFSHYLFSYAKRRKIFKKFLLCRFPIHLVRNDDVSWVICELSIFVWRQFECHFHFIREMWVKTSLGPTSSHVHSEILTLIRYEIRNSSRTAVDGEKEEVEMYFSLF